VVQNKIDFFLRYKKKVICDTQQSLKPNQTKTNMPKLCQDDFIWATGVADTLNHKEELTELDLWEVFNEHFGYEDSKKLFIETASHYFPDCEYRFVDNEPQMILDEEEEVEELYEKVVETEEVGDDIELTVEEVYYKKKLYYRDVDTGDLYNPNSGKKITNKNIINGAKTK